MSRQKIAHVFLLLFCSCCIFFTQFSEGRQCPTPNKPSGGFYTPSQSNYQTGDVITYECGEGYFASDRNSSVIVESTCQSSGLWTSVQRTFCDGPPLMPNSLLLREREISLNPGNDVIDGSRDTCYHSSQKIRITWVLTLMQRSLITAVKIYGRRGEAYRLEVIVHDGPSFGLNQTSCGFQDFTMQKDGIDFRCPEGTWGNEVFLKDWTRTVHIQRMCEIEIYTREAPVLQPCLPPTKVILKGYLEYRRNTATVRCHGGFRPSVEQDVLCQRAAWQTDGYYCIRDDEDTGAYQAIVLYSVLGVIVFLIALMITILFVRKQRRQSNQISSALESGATARSYSEDPSRMTFSFESTSSSKTAANRESISEHEYSQVRYSTLLDRVQVHASAPTYENTVY